MQSLQFESSPFYILIGIVIGALYALVVYNAKYHWSKNSNRLLFGLRTILVASLFFLLVGPIVKLARNIFEKPTVVFLIDNSMSIQEVTDSVGRDELKSSLEKVGKEINELGYEVVYKDLTNSETYNTKFTHSTSDLSTGIKNVTNSYEGKNLAGIVLVSDGIYNSGISPLYTPIRVPISTVGLGDTTDRRDLVLKNVSFNKITYQGNRFPVHLDVMAQGFPQQRVNVSAFKNGKLLSKSEQNTETKLFLNFDFSIVASEKGTQRIDLLIEPIDGEASIKNNRASIFVEVVEGRKKILLIAPAPHPDIKAIRTVVEKNSNYEFILHIPGVMEAEPAVLKPGVAELVIFHQIADRNNKTQALYQQYKTTSSSLLMVIGTQTNLRQLTPNQIPLIFENTSQWDEVTPVMNAGFHDFNFPENTNSIFSHYPPVEVPFGRFSYPKNATVLLYQRIGSVITDRPMLLSWEEERRKVAALIGEGAWKWRMNEFAETGKTEVFDDVFSKLIQYLSTLEDKQKFKSFPLQSEFADAVPVVIESQVYNDLFEPIYGNKILLEVKDEQQKTMHYQYVLSPGGTRYQIGGLKEGVYQFKSSTEINGKQEEVRGQFLVTAQNIESQNLTADFGLLRKLSVSTGGKFYSADKLSMLLTDFQKTKPQALIHTEESFISVINLKWIFFLLLIFISLEWFLRKYLGSY
jgi:hypothetical protein